MIIDETDWERHRAFLAVVNEGSLSGAARVLGVAQPTVRRRIADLEAKLGVVLFTRTPAGLDPTETAHALAGHAEAMAHAAAAFARTASAQAGEVAGVVRVTASEVIALEVLPPILATLQASHPGLVIILSPSNRKEDVLRREADIAVRMARPTQEGLVARLIGVVSLGLHARRDLLDRHGVPETIADVRRYGVIGPEHDNDILRSLRFGGVQVQPADFSFRSDSDVAQLAGLRAGAGIGVCQIPLGARDPSLVRLLPDLFEYPLETWMVTHEDLRGVARIRAVFDHLADGLTDYLRAQPSVAASMAVAAPRKG
ncbi:MAG: LysR family transcriptional regulator [Sphingomonas sp.]